MLPPLHGYAWRPEGRQHYNYKLHAGMHAVERDSQRRILGAPEPKIACPLRIYVSHHSSMIPDSNVSA
jgi:hypothetical protein